MSFGGTTQTKTSAAALLVSLMRRSLPAAAVSAMSPLVVSPNGKKRYTGWDGFTSYIARTLIDDDDATAVVVRISEEPDEDDEDATELLGWIDWLDSSDTVIGEMPFWVKFPLPKTFSLETTKAIVAAKYALTDAIKGRVVFTLRDTPSGPVGATTFGTPMETRVSVTSKKKGRSFYPPDLLQAAKSGGGPRAASSGSGGAGGGLLLLAAAAAAAALLLKGKRR